jgi:hypothetical protein
VNDKLYIHEVIDIVGHNRSHYLHHITANWGPIARETREHLCYGVWSTVGITSRWPQVINLWEDQGWDGLAQSLRVEYTSSSTTTHQDPDLAVWWAEAANYRSGGVDRILRPAPWAPTITDLVDGGMRAECYVHEMVKLRPGAADEYLQLLGEDGADVHGLLGLRILGAFENALVGGTECLVLWAADRFENWTGFERDQPSDARMASWRRRTSDLVVDWERVLLVEAPLSPLRLGRQPSVDDRASYALPTPR